MLWGPGGRGLCLPWALDLKVAVTCPLQSSNIVIRGAGSDCSAGPCTTLYLADAVSAQSYWYFRAAPLKPNGGTSGTIVSAPRGGFTVQMTPVWRHWRASLLSSTTPAIGSSSAYGTTLRAPLMQGAASYYSVGQYVRIQGNSTSMATALFGMAPTVCGQRCGLVRRFLLTGFCNKFRTGAECVLGHE
jgi:hypothetical protein